MTASFTSVKAKIAPHKVKQAKSLFKFISIEKRDLNSILLGKKKKKRAGGFFSAGLGFWRSTGGGL